MRKTVFAPVAVLLAAGLGLAQPGTQTLPNPPPRVLGAGTAPITADPSPTPPCPPDAGDGPGLLGCTEGPCAAPGRVWASADYLLWWIKDSRLPPLVTTSPPGSAAILGPNTTVLFGGSDLDNEERSGGRFLLGAWLDPDQTLGLEVGYLFLGSRSVRFGAAGSDAPGGPAIGRPFFDVNANAENSQLVAFPGRLAGSVNVGVSSRLQGWEANGVANLVSGCSYRVDVLGGFRYLQLNEGLGVVEDLAVNPAVASIGGTRFAVADQFDTADRFYGGQVGCRAEFRRGSWSVSGLAKVALGDTHEVVRINGGTVITPPGGAPVVGAGGLLALPSNIGRSSRDTFAVVPEGGVNVGYQLTRSLRANVGYTFLYWSRVVRPGDQIDRAVNPALLPTSVPVAGPTGPAQPSFRFRDTDFWAQGVNFGLEFRY